MPYIGFPTLMNLDNALDTGDTPQQKDGDQYTSVGRKDSACLVEWDEDNGTWLPLDTKTFSESMARAKDFEKYRQGDLYTDPCFAPGVDCHILDKPDAHMFDLPVYPK